MRLTSPTSRTTVFVSGFLFAVFALSFTLLAQKSRPKRPVVTRGNIATVNAIPPPKLSPELERRLAAFYQVWSSINNYYFDPKFSGLNWNNVRREYEPKVKAAKSDREVHTILAAMIGLLKRSHLAIIPPEIYETIEDAKRQVREQEVLLQKPVDGTPKDTKRLDEQLGDTRLENRRYGIGVDLKLIDDRFVISRLEKGSTAELAGLKTGYSIETINGVSLISLIEKLSQNFGTTKTDKIKYQLSVEIVETLLNSVFDRPVSLSYSDGISAAKEMSVPRQIIKNTEQIAIFANLPERTLEFESRSITEKVGYIRFNLFGLPVIDKFCNAISEHKSKDALIIDLRSNLGGVLGLMPVLAGMLSPNQTHIGTMQYRNVDEVLLGKSLPKHYEGRIVVLVDHGTVSAGEIFAQLLREHGRAVVVGQRTAGEALPSIARKLSTGAVFIYPIANFKSLNGRYLEGAGLEPDQTVLLDRKSLLDGDDNQLTAGLRLANDQSAFDKLRSVPVTSINPPGATTGRSINDPIGPGSFISRTPVIEAPRDFPAGRDQTASKYLADFLSLIGGKAALGRLASYSLDGVTSVSYAGNDFVLRAKIFRESSEKYAEHLDIPSAGETRQFLFGKKAIFQSQLEPGREFPFQYHVNEVDPLGIFFELADLEKYFPSLSFTGEYDRLGRKTAVIEGKDLSGSVIALAFDSERKLLVSVSGKLRNVSFGDYRQVGELKLPFSIERYGSTIEVKSIDVNKPIDDSNFERKLYCYDKP